MLSCLSSLSVHLQSKFIEGLASDMQVSGWCIAACRPPVAPTMGPLDQTAPTGCGGALTAHAPKMLQHALS